RQHQRRGLLLAAILTFGAVCWLNCVAIQTWEDAEAKRGTARDRFFQDRLDEHSMQENAAGRPVLTDFLGHHLTAFAITIGTLAFSLAYIPATRTVWPLFAAVAVSSLLFLWLTRHTQRFSALSLRILADGALLTPLIFFLHVR
ncbi:MAG: hypothetical protein ACYCPD_07290, partial [Acidobacteriaceae bacterium]